MRRAQGGGKDGAAKAPATRGGLAFSFSHVCGVWRKTVFRVDATPGELTRIFRLTEGAAAASLALPPRALRPAPPSPQGR